MGLSMGFGVIALVVVLLLATVFTSDFVRAVDNGVAGTDREIEKSAWVVLQSKLLYYRTLFRKAVPLTAIKIFITV